KRRVLVCERGRDRCGAEDARRKLLVPTDSRSSEFWPDCWPRGRRAVYVLLVGVRRTESGKGNREDEDFESRSGCRAERGGRVLQQSLRRHERRARQRDGEIHELQPCETHGAFAQYGTRG